MASNRKNITHSTRKRQSKNKKPKVRPGKSGSKFDKAPVSIWDIDEKDLRYIKIHDAERDKEGRPVCPECGIYDVRPLDYGMSPPTKQHLGSMFFVIGCLKCRTVFKYFSTPF